MGQLLIVQGENEGEVRQWFRAGIAAHVAIHGCQNADEWEQPGIAVASFQRPVAPARIVRNPDPAAPAWICGAGTWFYEGATGEDGLRRLGAARGRNPEVWLRPVDGAFAIAMPGEEPGDLLVLTDRLGTLHIYQAQAGSCVLLCTSSLTLAAALQREWDPAGLRYFLATGSVFERHSLFSGIEKLPPASVTRFMRGREVSQSKYWSLAGVCYDQAPVTGDVPGLAAGLRSVMALVGKNYDRAALDLTGGYDSRALVGAMLQEPGLQFPTVVNGPADSPDAICAAHIAEVFGLSHERRDRGPADPAQLWQRALESIPMTDGECDMLMHAGVLEAHHNISKRFNATINGSNGEICKGQWWEILLPHIGSRGHFDARMVAANRFAYGASAAPLLAHRFEDDLVDDFAGIIRRATVGMERHPNTALLDCVYLTLRMQRWQGRIMSATNRIWPAVSPFAFREPMEMALSAPVKLRVRHRMSRRLIEYQNPKLAAMPLAQGYPALPVRWNTLHRFWPLAVETGRMGMRAALRKAGLQSRKEIYIGYPLTRIAHLEEVRELLQPERMASRDLYDHGRLHDFLASGELSVPAGRILTVEMTARVLRNAALVRPGVARPGRG